MMCRPRVSVTSSGAPVSRALRTSLATDSAVASVSTTSSRGTFCTPMVISTTVLRCHDCLSRTRAVPVILGVRRLGSSSARRARLPSPLLYEAGHPAPGQLGDELDGVLDAHLLGPVARRRGHPGEADQRGAEQLGLGGWPRRRATGPR